MTDRESLFIKKKLLKKQGVLFIIILWCSYTNKVFVFRYLVNFTMKCIEGQIKGFNFLICTAFDQKSRKCASGNSLNTKVTII